MAEQADMRRYRLFPARSFGRTAFVHFGIDRGTRRVGSVIFRFAEVDCAGEAGEEVDEDDNDDEGVCSDTVVRDTAGGQAVDGVLEVILAGAVDGASEVGCVGEQGKVTKELDEGIQERQGMSDGHAVLGDHRAIVVPEAARRE